MTNKLKKIMIVSSLLVSFAPSYKTVDPNKFSDYCGLIVRILSDGQKEDLLTKYQALICAYNTEVYLCDAHSILNDYVLEAFKLNPSLTASTDPAKNPDLLYKVCAGNMIKFSFGIYSYDIMDPDNKILTLLKSREKIT